MRNKTIAPEFSDGAGEKSLYSVKIRRVHGDVFKYEVVVSYEGQIISDKWADSLWGAKRKAKKIAKDHKKELKKRAREPQKLEYELKI